MTRQPARCYCDRAISICMMGWWVGVEHVCARRGTRSSSSSSSVLVCSTDRDINCSYLTSMRTKSWRSRKEGYYYLELNALLSILPLLCVFANIASAGTQEWCRSLMTLAKYSYRSTSKYGLLITYDSIDWVYYEFDSILQRASGLDIMVHSQWFTTELEAATAFSTHSSNLGLYLPRSSRIFDPPSRYLQKSMCPCMYGPVYAIWCTINK